MQNAPTPPADPTLLDILAPAHAALDKARAHLHDLQQQADLLADPDVSAVLIEYADAEDESDRAHRALTEAEYEDNTPEAKEAWSAASSRCYIARTKLLALARATRDQRAAKDSDEEGCPGHESTVGPAGVSTYCDGSCRPARVNGLQVESRL